MELTATTISAHLKNRQAQAAAQRPVLYVVSSDEILLQQEVGDTLRAAFFEEGFTQRQVFHADSNFNWKAFLMEVRAPSLFAPQRLLEVRIPEGKAGRDGPAVLAQLVRDLKDSFASSQERGKTAKTMIVIAWNYLRPKAELPAWLSEALDGLGAQACVLARLDKIAASALPNWLAQRMAQNQQRVVSGEEGVAALRFFADQVSGNLLAAAQEIEKLASLYPAGELSLAQIARSVGDVAHFEIPQWPLLVLSGQCMQAQRVLLRLAEMGEASVRVHFYLRDELRALVRVAADVRGGAAVDLVLRNNRIWYEREKMFRLLIPRISERVENRLLASAVESEAVLKGLPQSGWPQSDQPWLVLGHWALLVHTILGLHA